MNRNGQFWDVTLRSVVANWASVFLILGAQPDFYSLWASGRPLICIPVEANFAKKAIFLVFFGHTVQTKICKTE